MEFLVAVLASALGGAALGVIGLYLRNRSAPARYVRRIRLQIQQGVAEGPNHAFKNAKIIVASRNALATSLEALGELLNSEITKLETLLGGGSQSTPRTRPQERFFEETDPQAVYQQIQVLEGYWKAREDTVATSIRKVLVDLGVL